MKTNLLLILLNLFSQLALAADAKPVVFREVKELNKSADQSNPKDTLNKLLTIPGVDKAYEECKNDPLEKVSGCIWGKLSQDLKTKVQEADKAYNLINKALELSPNYAEALVVKGAYIREIANLNVILKTVAEHLYGKLPDCSNDGALALFFKALAFYPESKLINYEIAKTYFNMRSLDLAEKYINAAVTGEMDITTEKHITIDIELLQSQIINEKESIRYAAES